MNSAKMSQNLTRGVSVSTRAESTHRCANDHEPQRQSGYAIQPESENDDVDRAMHRAVQDSKAAENPGSNQVAQVDSGCDEEVKHDAIEKRRQLEEILEVVRWIGHGRRRDTRELRRSQAI